MGKTEMSVVTYVGKHTGFLKSSFILCVAFFLSVLLAAGPSKAEEAVSGRLENGFRVLSADTLAASPDIRVFRGDYIKFELDGEDGTLFSVPALDIEVELPSRDGQTPYFKMKQVGVFDYFLGQISGTLRVVEYEGAHYQALTATEARAVMENLDPLILDVRTPGEFKAGRIEGAKLIPVQVLDRHLASLSEYKDTPVLLYCATGNRSTVAAKILIDNGFKRIFNLKKGIKDWQRQGLPMVR